MVPRIDFQEHRLSNGLQVLLHRDNRVPLVHVTLHYRVGSSYERPGLSGFAHLFEHMMFQGSENVGKFQHGRHVDSAGGSWNATTNKDRTNYFETVPSHYLELALWLEADRMRSLKVTPENFENQRQTVIEEKKQSYDNRPYGLAYLKFDALAYANWAYGHPIIGSVEDLQQAGWEDAWRFHQTYYGPARAVLVLGGDIAEDEALEKIRRHFESIPDQGNAADPHLDEPEQTAEKFEAMQDPLAPLAAVSMGFHMSALGQPDYYALSILAIVLGHGESSRLYRRLIYENNWITSLSVGPNQYKGPELFNVWFQIQSGVEVKKVLQVLDEELRKVQEEEITRQELEKARNQIAFFCVNRLTTVAGVGEWLARYAVYFNDPHLINKEWDRFMSVTPDGILQAARQTFQPPQRTTIVVEPGQHGD